MRAFARKHKKKKKKKKKSNEKKMVFHLKYDSFLFFYSFNTNSFPGTIYDTTGMQCYNIACIEYKRVLTEAFSVFQFLFALQKFYNTNAAITQPLRQQSWHATMPVSSPY